MMKLVMIISLLNVVMATHSCVELSRDVTDFSLSEGESIRIHQTSVTELLTITTNTGDEIGIIENKISSSYAMALTLDVIEVIWLSFSDNKLTIRCPQGGIQLQQTTTTILSLTLNRPVDYYKLTPSELDENSHSGVGDCATPDIEEEPLLFVMAFESGSTDEDIVSVENFLVIKTSPYDMSQTPPPPPSPTPIDGTINFELLPEGARIVKFEIYGFDSTMDSSIFEHIVKDHLHLSTTVGLYTKEAYVVKKEYNYDIMETEWLIATVVVNIVALFAVCLCVYWCCLKRYPAMKLNIGGIEHEDVNDSKSLLAGTSCFEDESAVIDNFDDGFRSRPPSVVDGDCSDIVIESKRQSILVQSRFGGRSPCPSERKSPVSSLNGSLRRVHVIAPSDSESEDFQVPDVGLEEEEEESYSRNTNSPIAITSSHENMDQSSPA